MKRSSVLLATLIFAATGYCFSPTAVAQRSARDDDRTAADRDSRTDANRDGLKDDEVRVRYNDDTDRLQIDVEEDIQFRDDERRGEDQGWLDEGSFKLNYDTGTDELAVQGSGTIDVNQVGMAVANWWQSWWEQEKDRRRSASEGVEAGSRVFLKQYDDNNDSSLTLRELPISMQDEFSQVDSNSDERLSKAEIRDLGAAVFNSRNQQRSGQDQRTASTSGDDQTWSEWWASWWSEDQQRGDDAQGAQGGTDRLLSQYDDNNSGKLSRSELPQRMRGDFHAVDRNDDNLLSATELRKHGDMLHDQGRYTVGRADVDSDNAGSDDDQTWSQWWNSWFTENEGDDAEQLITTGARQFIRNHDRNDDGYLMRSELPQRMYDDFARIDRNDDRYLSRSEIERVAQQDKANFSQRSSNGSSTSQATQPARVVVVWVADVDDRQLDLGDLQQAYEKLQQVDDDGDGDISRGEVSEFRDRSR
jgi:Ca2+-binding EF-hand superfamily protein